MIKAKALGGNAQGKRAGQWSGAGARSRGPCVPSQDVGMTSKELSEVWKGIQRQLRGPLSGWCVQHLVPSLSGDHATSSAALKPLFMFYLI